MGLITAAASGGVAMVAAVVNVVGRLLWRQLREDAPMPSTDGAR